MKIEEQVLSREQMAHLVELGVDTSDASMAWVSNSDNPKADDWTIEIPNEFLEHYYQVPTYTIGDIIEKLPKEVDDNRLEICLSDKTIGYTHFGVCAYHEDYDILIDGLYDCFCWVAENHMELIM